MPKGGSLGGGTERDSWESEDGLPLPLDIQDPRAGTSLLGVFKSHGGGRTPSISVVRVLASNVGTSGSTLSTPYT